MVKFWIFSLILLTLSCYFVACSFFDFDSKDDVESLISKAGFPYESYEVETEDKYQLKIHRIKNIIPRKVVTPVFFMHGLFATAADFIITGRDIALPYLLSDNGFDCWLGNARGNDFSLKHATLSSSSKEFWNFSFHEIGHFDLAAMLDFILKKTNSSKLFFVGHSQGAAALMVLLSTRPECNSKIAAAHLMAPAVFLNNLPHPFIRFFASEFNAFVDKYRTYDIMSSSQIMKFIEPLYSFVCQRNSFAFDMCSNMMSFMCGQNENGTEIDLRILPDFLKHLAHAVSIKQIHHFIQLYQSGKFQMYDYLVRNVDVYKRSTPPEYDLEKVVAGVYLYCGKNDDLVAEKDVDHLSTVLPNVRKYRKIRNYNHCDFNYGRNSRRGVFRSILNSIRSAELRGL